MQKLHVDPISGQWVECRPAVGSAFTAHKSLPSGRLLPDLIRETPILLYAGDKDFGCNYLGLERVIEDLERESTVGSHRPRTPSLSSTPWIVENRTVGQWYSMERLTYVRYYNASHMVPYNHPRQVKSMIYQFLSANARATNDSFSGDTEANITTNVDQAELTRVCFWILLGISALAAIFTLVLILVGSRPTIWTPIRVVNL
jgi:carboxypeptidase C (cathepsin A)